MIVGVIVSDDITIRAANSLAADPHVDEVVVFAPATSQTFRVVEEATGIPVAVGAGVHAPAAARRLKVPLVWNGEVPEEGVLIYGASPQGLALALAARETDPQLVAVAHPDLEGGTDQKVRFPDPVGRCGVRDSTYSGRRVATARSPNQFSAVLTNGVGRRVTMVDDGAFMAGVALAAGVAIAADGPGPVWDSALEYLLWATEMGLVMARDG